MTPVITIFVRHAADCKYAGDEFSKRCNCRKHFRWTQGGKQFRRGAKTRSWAEAEDNKRRLEDQLLGRTPVAESNGQALAAAVQVFVQDKKAQGVAPDTLGKYVRELERLQRFCEGHGVFVAQRLDLEVLSSFRATWEDLYPSSYTRSIVQKRLKVFLRFCHDAGWLDRIPRLSPLKVDEPETMPLSAAEYARLLTAVPLEFPEHAGRMRAVIQLMRWSGLAVRDAVMLKRTEIQTDAKGLHHIVIARQKTGTPVSVPIPADVAAEVLTVLNGHPVYVFWDGTSTPPLAAHRMSKWISRVFTRAKIQTLGHMKSHRLRDTFAVDLLQKGVPLEHVSKLLGHTSIATTEKSYAQWVKGRQDRLDSIVSDSWK
jgi:integrase/recombinase XerD